MHPFKKGDKKKCNNNWIGQKMEPTNILIRKVNLAETRFCNDVSISVPEVLWMQHCPVAKHSLV